MEKDDANNEMKFHKRLSAAGKTGGIAGERIRKSLLALGNAGWSAHKVIANVKFNLNPQPAKPDSDQDG